MVIAQLSLSTDWTRKLNVLTARVRGYFQALQPTAKVVVYVIFVCYVLISVYDICYSPWLPQPQRERMWQETKTTPSRPQVQAKHSLNSVTTQFVMKQQTAKVASAAVITTPGVMKQQNVGNASSAAVGKKRARPEVVSREESRKRARTDATNPKPQRRQMKEQAMKHEARGNLYCCPSCTTKLPVFTQ
jgi:hypothetical protein